MNDIKFLDIIRKYTLQNAYEYGKAQAGNIIGKVIADYPECKRDMKNTMQVITKEIEKINKMKKEEIENEMKKYNYITEKREREGLPQLDFGEKGEQVNTRIAPNPGGILHLGHAKQIVLCDEYAKMYNGKFYVRLEDTDPKTKKPLLEAYKKIPQDIEWLGCKVKDTIKQSERMEIYYEYAEKLIKMDKAYVCTCLHEDMKINREKGIACSCRQRTIEENLNKWEKMKINYREGEAVLRIKTDMKHPNSSIRDWPAFRIITEEHPITKNKYRVWPLYNFSCAIDDHLTEITLVIRGKEHELNGLKQKYIYKYFKWKEPYFRESGILKLSDKFAHKSDIRNAIQKGEISGWEDIQLPTLGALKRRGIQPEAIREYMINIGLKPTDSNLDWNILYKINTKYIKEKAVNLIFIKTPKEIEINGEKYFIENEDFENNKGKEVRMKNLMNAKINLKGEKLEDKKSDKIVIIPWIKKEDSINAILLTSEGKRFEGKVETKAEKLKEGGITNFEKIGYARLDNKFKLQFILSYS
ncbi:glutamate--tRNA ligase [Candidatus Micrarchaeota archaeon]|nr:glutamate--tRNA ligase [Candidatus Micrarchaeota archaeon]